MVLEELLQICRRNFVRIIWDGATHLGCIRLRRCPLGSDIVFAAVASRRATGALGAGRYGEVFPLPSQTVEGGETSAKGSADDHNDVDGVERQSSSDETRERSDDAAFGAAGHGARRWGLGVDAAVAGAVAGVENR